MSLPIAEAAPGTADPPERGRIVTGQDYVDSLRGRGLRVFLFGKLVEEPVDHPMIRPSIDAVAETSTTSSWPHSAPPPSGSSAAAATPSSLS